jgi:hypothetical protein
VNKEEVSQRTKEGMNILQTIKRTKANWIGLILLRKCHLQHVIEGKIEGRIEVTSRRRRRRLQLLYDLKETRGYWKLKEEPLDRHLRIPGFGRSYESFVRETSVRMFTMCFKSYPVSFVSI